jgi:hypothetical protein
MQQQIPDEVARVGALLRDPTARDLLESASLLFFASLEESVGHLYAPMAAGSSARQSTSPIRDSAPPASYCS